MKKNLFIALLFLASSFNAISQSVSARKDSLKIDSIKKNLPQLKGIDHVEAMIFLCEYYSDKLKYKNINAADSIRLYGNKILNESKKINYKRGIAMGILTTAPDSLKEKNARVAMQIAEEIKDEEIQGWAQFILNSTSLNANKNTTNQQLVVDHFNKAGKILRAVYLNTWLCQGYLSEGENEKAFDCARENLETLKRIQPPEFAYIYNQSLLWNYWNMKEIFSAAGDYGEALKYIYKTDEIDRADNSKSGGWTIDISIIYAQLGKNDSAMMYWNRGRKYDPSGNDTVNWKPGTILSYNYLADLYNGKKQYGKAIEILKKNNLYFDSLIKYYSGNYKHAGYYGKMVASLLLGKAYDSTKNYKPALQSAKDGLNIARRENRRPEIMQGYQLLSSVYYHLGKNDSAYEYLLKYHSIKDSIQSKQFLLRIYNSKKEAEDVMKESRIGLLNRDNQIKQQQLKQQATFRNFLIAVFIAIIFAGLFVFRNLNLKRKNEMLQQQQKEQQWKLKELESENKHVELQKQSAELEMQALRAQMNPHFIFNSLSSINHFILKNESKTASNYLTRFSRLIRMVLINSQKPLITLQDELEMLRIYLDMERLRVKNSFDYVISFINQIDADAVFVPPLILQPFCENALWHGLMHKEGHGSLNIDLSMENNILQCVITDDGIGRAKAAELKSKSSEKARLPDGQEKSLGLQITTQRLALLNQNKNVQTFYTIDDILDENKNVAGTKVILKIGYKELEEELV
jgi:tetratricopeptide (TPR) repeat protein